MRWLHCSLKDDLLMDERITAECPVANEFTRENLRDFCAWWIEWNGEADGMKNAAANHFRVHRETVYRCFDDIHAHGEWGKPFLLAARAS